jgi:hypothetical protein
MNDVLERSGLMFEQSTGLGKEDALVAGAWSIATYGNKELQRFPILAVEGQTSTGKSTTLKIVHSLAYQTQKSILNGSLITKAALRDELHYERTVVLDEADHIDEQMLIYRYDRDTGAAALKFIQSEKSGWSQGHLQMFGPIAIHRRIPFKDPAILSRTVVVETRPKRAVDLIDVTQLETLRLDIEKQANDIDWSEAIFGTNRIEDSWQPIKVVAKHFENSMLLDYIDEAVERATADLVAGQGHEPNLILFSCVLEAAFRESGQSAERVALSWIQECATTNGQPLNSWQIGRMARQLGFQVVTKGGKSWIMTGGDANLRKIGKQLGSEDDFVTEA